VFELEFELGVESEPVVVIAFALEIELVIVYWCI
jgi:hypothetical protein